MDRSQKTTVRKIRFKVDAQELAVSILDMQANEMLQTLTNKPKIAEQRVQFALRNCLDALGIRLRVQAVKFISLDSHPGLYAHFSLTLAGCDSAFARFAKWNKAWIPRTPLTKNYTSANA